MYCWDNRRYVWKCIKNKFIVFFFGLEAILGTKIDSQEGKKQELISAFDQYFSIYSFFPELKNHFRFYKDVIERITKPWLHSDIIFNLTKNKTEQDKCVKFFKTFFQNVRFQL